MSETEKKAESPKEEAPRPVDNLVETHHTLTLGGRELRYTATTGTIVLKEETEKDGAAEGEKPKAGVFFIAYTLDDVPDRSQRPITFSFNGGPGSSSVWLHLGVLGPRRVLMDDEGQPLPPPYRLVDNAHSLLDVSDLVFIDPVSTGYSRVVPGEKPRTFHGFRKDIESVGDFIRLYATRYQRWGSPKYLIGESYGTTRAAGLSGYLQERHGLYLNGIMLISSVLEFQTLDFTPGNDLPYVMFLPGYTAAAWYHRCLAPELQADLRQTLAEVEAFAVNEYTPALMLGAALPAEARAALVQRLSRYTGLSADFIDRANLRVEDRAFFKELLRARRLSVGRLDSRFLGTDRHSVGYEPDYDPSLTGIIGPYTATFYDYVRGALKYESDLPYEILNPRVWPWSFAEHENSFVNVAETLRRAMTINPHLRVYVASGYFDLATPYFATDYTFNRLGLAEPRGAAGRVRISRFEAGHMMYIHAPSLARLKQDLAEFVGEAA